MAVPVLEARSLTKTYGEFTALEDLDLEVHAGEVLGFLGPNGAGKTTTIRLFLDLIRPTRGTALLFGKPASNVASRARIGYLPGELALDERLSGERMLDLLDNLRTPGSAPAEQSRRDELCERLRLTSVDRERPLRASSRGTKQKFGLISAMERDPDLLILDEPTTGLDPIVREEVLLLFTEAGARGRTVFHSSHVVSEVERTSARIAILRNGKLVAIDATEGMRRTLVRRMQVRFAGPVPKQALDRAGASILSVDGSAVELAVRGDLNPLLAILAQHTVEHLVFPEPELEDALRHHLAGTPDA